MVDDGLKKTCGHDNGLNIWCKGCHDELLAEYREALLDMVYQHCAIMKEKPPEEFDSMCLSANADAMRLLIRDGVLVKSREGHGRRVFAKYGEENRNGKR